MSFVRTLPEEMTFAAGQLAGIGEALTMENAASLAPTTAIAPAGTDPVSLMQAALFSTYGSLYQSISDQAAVIHQQLVATIDQNALAYSSAESTNEASTSLGSAIEGFLTNILGVPTSGSSSLLSGNAANLGNIGLGNWASAGSALIGLAGGGLLDFPEEAAAGAGLVGFDEALLANAMLPGGVGGAPLVASMAPATTTGALAAPPTWAGESVATAAPARLAASTVAPGHTTGMMAIPAAMPAGAAGGRGVGKFGAPRYGVKPNVAPKPTTV